MVNCHCIILIVINFSQSSLGCYIDFGLGPLWLDILVLKLNNLLWS